MGNPITSLWKFINNTDKVYQLLRIEVSVLIIVMLFLLIFIMGLLRRTCRSRLLRYPLLVIYAAFSLVITYTMSMIHDSTIRHPRLSIWAAYTVSAFGGVDTIVAYGLQDHENRHRYLVEASLLGFYFFLLLLSTLYRQKTIFWFVIPMNLGITIWKNIERLRSSQMASQSGLAKIAKPTANYMLYEDEMSVGDHDQTDPSSMKGYKYLLEDPTDGNDYVTLEKLWQFEDRMIFISNNHYGRKLKDICLSFALFKLLLRRFAGYPAYEASKEKTWKFIRYGLLGDPEEYSRPFEVIEGELQFVYDLFYTKYYMLNTFGGNFNGLWFRYFYFMWYVGGAIGLLITFLRRPMTVTYPTSKWKTALVLDIGISTFATLMFILTEFLQFVMLLLSDWTTVRWVVRYVKTGSLDSYNWKVLTRYLPKALKLRQYSLFRPWGRKLGQYSFLDNYTSVPHSLRLANRIRATRPISSFMTLPKIGQVEDSSITLSMEVKRAIIESLKAYKDDYGRPKLTNGITSLARNGVYSISLVWACRLETQADIIYAWHIATTICEWSTPKEFQTDCNFHVATSLSKYCAYLATFAPDLLPEHSLATECIFDNLVLEASNFFGEGASKATKHQKLTGLREEDPYGSTTLKQGGLLAQNLLNQVQDEARKWKVLADFWAELILFLAPSDKAMAHVEHLAFGGEFITHLWVLLTHAGIIEASSN